jgi:hypothetical protein
MNRAEVIDIENNIQDVVCRHVVTLGNANAVLD